MKQSNQNQEKTYGLSKFFSNIQKRTLPSIALMTISLIDTENKKSYPIATKQVIKPKKENKKKQKSVVWKAKKRKPGRPKGSKNKAKDPTKDILYQLLDTLLRIVNSLFISCLGNLPCVYLTLDGYFGNQHYMRLAKKHSLHLISKLKYNSALYLPFEGQYNGNGRPNKYGTKINVKKPDNKYFVGTKTEKKFKYDFYQIQVWSRKYIDAKLNVVIIICKNLKTGKTKNCILFSTDLNLSYDKIIQYYSLRFQIEFNFRDAKQYFGLADFKNYKEIQLTNAINLSFFMCNLTYILSNNFKEQFGLKKASILDLKTYYRTEYIANKTYKLKIKEKKTVQFLNPLQIFNIAKNQAVNF